MIDVSNQARSHDEDIINKPWRPIPAGRINETQAIFFRWTMAALCISTSLTFDYGVAAASLGAVIASSIHDELRFSEHCIRKILCNVWEYTTLEFGATKLMGISFLVLARRTSTERHGTS